jgi:hypothetical protein
MPLRDLDTHLPDSTGSQSSVFIGVRTTNTIHSLLHHTVRRVCTNTIEHFGASGVTRLAGSTAERLKSGYRECSNNIFAAVLITRGLRKTTDKLRTNRMIHIVKHNWPQIHVTACSMRCLCFTQYSSIDLWQKKEKKKMKVT